MNTTPEPFFALDAFFDASLAAHPHRLAIEQGDVCYTYEQTDCLANKLAHYLIEQGVCPGAKVVLLMHRSAEVYIAMLAVLRAGGAYIPLDSEIPADRVGFIMSDSEAKLLITTPEIMLRIGSEPSQHPLFVFTPDAASLAAYPTHKPEVPLRDASDLCYIIYTSGTSGMPKGVLLEHRNVITYITDALTIYPIGPADRALQGFSVSFDASVEEIWVPWAAGATIVVGTFEIMRSGDQFSQILTRLGISFLSCAPTLLSMVKDDIPTLRILIFGGEVCPADLAHRWCREGRMVYNTYGPTEAAVIATYCVLNPGDEVTIGRHLPHYEVLIVDEALNPVNAEEEGEILIGGECVARGYLHRDDLTQQKFIETDRFAGIAKRYYRTGDIGRFAPNGEIRFVGRADAQVKVRGFRVELSEIEGLLLKCEGVQAAAVALDSATQQLAAYVVVQPQADLQRDGIANLLRMKLPYYMIPATLDTLDELPLTPSQKIDRKRLPAPQTPLVFAADKTIVPPRTAVEKALVAVIGAHLNRTDLSMDDHFFEDLSGHSLLAAVIVSELRQQKLFENMSVVDVYKFPVLSQLAAAIEQKKPLAESSAAEHRDVHIPASLSYYLCSAAQGVSLFFLILLFGMEWLGPFFVYSYYYQAESGVWDSLLLMLLMYFALLPVLSLFAIAFKWLVIGRIRPGKYKLWGSYYFRFWLVDKVIHICPVSYFAGTSLMNGFLRMLGARVGKNCYINTSAISAFDLIDIGDRVSVCTDSHLRGYHIADGYLHLGKITLGDDVFVGTRCCLSHDTTMEAGSSVDDLTLVPAGMVIPANEHRGGSPAVPLGENTRATPKPLWSLRNNVLYALSIFLIPLITMLAYWPGMMAIAHLDYIAESYHFLWMSLLVSVSFVMLLTLIIVALKWMLLGNIKEGRYAVNSLFYYKKWFYDQLMKLSLQVLGTLYTTLYLQIWFRMLGVKMGKRVEISTVEFISPDLLVTGDECFLADSVSVGASHVRNGYIDIARTYIGNRTFVGNSAVLSPQTRLGDNVLVGVLSKVSPANLPAPDGTSWFGSPAVYLPKRDINTDFSQEQTYHPTRKLFALRYFIEFFRVILPSAFFILMAVLITDVASYLQVERDLHELFLVFPLLYVGAALVGLLLMAAFKWVIVGKYISSKKPLWSHFVWRSELVTGLYENFLVLFFLNLLTGTPFIKYPLRLLGCKIGRRVAIFTTQITEFDLVKVGDYSALNDNCTLQTHLFEDRVMKMSVVDIGNHCSVGGMAVVLYDSKMEDGSSLGPLSVLMKGEVLPSEAEFVGAPAKRI